jgi:lipopolysaccharide/colanic/teichoic acid biosynthesis glycosyltransferase
LTLSTLGLVVLSPVMLLIAAAILVDSGRPVIFTQTRLGRGGRTFRMHKFRKFRSKASRVGLPLTLKHDSRMSRVGRFLAATKLDELPQLWNILRGEMSVVGPRPESLDFADCFIGPYRSVLDHQPGILGPTQVAFRDESSLYGPADDPTHFYREVLFPLKAQMDLSYYERRTLAADIGWMLRGTVAVLRLRRADVAQTSRKADRQTGSSVATGPAPAPGA